MKKNSIAQFAGVIISFIIIWLVNDFLLVDHCKELSGTFNYSTGECLLASGEVNKRNFSDYLMAVYFIGGITVALFTAHIIRKIFKIER